MSVRVTNRLELARLGNVYVEMENGLDVRRQFQTFVQSMRFRATRKSVMCAQSLDRDNSTVNLVLLHSRWIEGLFAIHWIAASAWNRINDSWIENNKIGMTHRHFSAVAEGACLGLAATNPCVTYTFHFRFYRDDFHIKNQYFGV